MCHIPLPCEIAVGVPRVVVDVDDKSICGFAVSLKSPQITREPLLIFENLWKNF